MHSWIASSRNLIDASERTARRLVSSLLGKRLIVSDSHRALLRLGSRSMSLSDGFRGSIARTKNSLDRRQEVLGVSPRH